jgi:hypothetical protein
MYWWLPRRPERHGNVSLQRAIQGCEEVGDFAVSIRDR